jgi:plasmid pSH1452, rep
VNYLLEYDGCVIRSDENREVSVMVTVNRSDFVKGVSAAAVGVALGVAGVGSAAVGAELPKVAKGASSPSSPEFIRRVISLGDNLRFKDDTGALSVQLTDHDLRARFGFGDDDVKHLRAVVAESARGDKSVFNQDYEARSGARFYISYDDLTAGVFAVLATAAAAGPEPLAAAWVGVSSMIGGPVGTVVSGGVALLGIGFFVNLAGKILGAIAQGKGVALYLDWGFPPIVPEIE